MKKRASNTYARVGVPEKFEPFRDVTVPTIKAVDCPKCGRIWSGEGEVCPACWYAMQGAIPRKAEPKRHTPAPISLRPVRVVSDSHDTDRPDRCHYSDLPMDQCACGHHQERTSA